jgi:hypothetical protein
MLFSVILCFLLSAPFSHGFQVASHYAHSLKSLANLISLAAVKEQCTPPGGHHFETQTSSLHNAPFHFEWNWQQSQYGKYIK